MTRERSGERTGERTGERIRERNGERAIGAGLVKRTRGRAGGKGQGQDLGTY